MSDERYAKYPHHVVCENFTLTWANCTTTNVAPGTDTAIDVMNAHRIAIQVDSTDSDNTSTNTDLNVLATMDGTTYDTTVYAATNFGDDAVKTILIEPGPKKIKLRLDENGSLRADVTAIVRVWTG